MTTWPRCSCATTTGAVGQVKTAKRWRLSLQSSWGIVKRYAAEVGVVATPHVLRGAFEKYSASAAELVAELRPSRSGDAGLANVACTYLACPLHPPDKRGTGRAGSCGSIIGTKFTLPPGDDRSGRDLYAVRSGVHRRGTRDGCFAGGRRWRAQGAAPAGGVGEVADPAGSPTPPRRTQMRRPHR